jgi:uncharacterized membrane protein YfcA
MSPVDRRSIVDQWTFQSIPILPCICFLFFILAILWSRTVPSSEASLWVVFFSALLSSIAGFAFSPIAGAFLFHIFNDAVLVVQILLIASVAQQIYCIWRLRSLIGPLEFLPYLAGSLTTLPLGIFLLLKSEVTSYLPVLGFVLIAYGALTVLKPTINIKRNVFAGRLAVGALGGLTGGLAAFPAAFVTIWCQAQGFSKERQRAIIQPFILVNQLVAAGILSFVRPLGAASIEIIQYMPPAILGAYFGLLLFGKLNTASFNRIVGVLLFLAGGTMAAKIF